MAEPVPENNEIKQRAIRRLIVAAGLVLLAVGILTYLSYHKPAKVITKPTPVEPVQALAEPLPAETPSATAQPVVPPPPPPIVAAKPSLPPSPAMADSAPASAQPAPRLPAALPKPVPAPSGYVVQFGVFTNPQNAQRLVQRLKQAGIAVHTETRVQLPAFKTKAEAEAALAKMKAKGITATIVAH